MTVLPPRTQHPAPQDLPVGPSYAAPAAPPWAANPGWASGPSVPPPNVPPPNVPPPNVPPPGGIFPAGSSATSPQPPRRRARWLAVPATALVAAVAASGLTYGAMSGSPSAAPGTTITRVIQGDTSNPDWTVTAAAAAPAVVAISVQSAQESSEGSGVVLDTAGHIVTNNHVVAGGSELWVTLSDRRRYQARAVGTDPSTDLAVIKLTDPPANLTPIAFGRTDQLKVGEPVMALGNPLGLSETVTTGIISALNRPVVTSQEPAQGNRRASTRAEDVVTNAIQTNAAINPGNSGGALVNANGELIGITSSIASLGTSSGESGNIGIGFAIPAAQVKSVSDQLITGGRAEHAYLGVATSDTETTLGGAGYEGAGVQSVSTGAPAEQAGLRVGDVIIGVDSDPVGGSEGLIAQIRDRKVGDRVNLRVSRNGAEVQVGVTLVAAPQ